MKSFPWLWGGLAWLAAASVLAQDSAPPAKPPAVSRGVSGPLAKDDVLQSPAAATVKIDSLIVRSKPDFSGDILTHLVKGEPVTVLEQITLAKPKLNEPANWARIVLPANAAVWVFAKYINTNSMTVTGTRVRVESRPDDLHDKVAFLEKGAPVQEVRRLPDWIQIVPPTNACGFVASEYLTMETPAAPPPASVAAAEPPAAAPAAAAPAATASATPAKEDATVAPAPVTSEALAPPATNTAPEATNATAATAPPPPIIAPEPVATTPAAAPTNSEPPAAVIPPAPAPAPAVVAPVAVEPVAVAPALAAAGIDAKPRIVTREGYGPQGAEHPGAGRL
jgi:hypothetical protein